MFRLNQNYEVDRRILKSDYVRISPAEISPINSLRSQIYIIIPREDSVISLLESYPDLNLEVIKTSDNSRYGNCKDIKLVNQGPIVLFNKFKLTTSSGNHLKNISHAHIVSLLYKQTGVAKDSDDLFIVFDRIRDKRGDELSSNRNTKCKNHVRNTLEEIFGSAEHQEKTIFGLGYK